MAEIVELRGNIFASSADAVIVTVNCVGDMGAGIALEARYRYPAMAARYRELCEAGAFQPGRLWLWTDSDPWVMCFPTKKHWRHPSRMEYVVAGLDKLADTYRDKSLTSVAMPHLGASHGGLDWERVREQVHLRLGPLPDLRVEVYEYSLEAPDPWFERLRAGVGGLSAEGLAQELGLKPQASRTLAAVLNNAEAHNFAALHAAPGFGEKSLEIVYRYAFGVSSPASRQLELGIPDPE